MRLEWYVEQISDRIIVPAARPSLQSETASSGVLQGNGAFGIYGMQVAGDLAVAKARECQVSAVALTDVGHTGRLGQFAEKIAAEGMFCMILGGGNHERWGCVAPYGGGKPFLPTNPYAFGLPAGKYGAVVVDFATSAVATGKLRLHRAGGLPIPFGWILDQRGQPSTNAEDFFQGGMQLPAGGPKGYGLAVIAEIIGSALLGPPREFNWLIIAINLNSFRNLDEYTELSAKRFWVTLKQFLQLLVSAKSCFRENPNKNQSWSARRKAFLSPRTYGAQFNRQEKPSDWIQTTSWRPAT